MAAIDTDDWSTGSTDATSISLVRSKPDGSIERLYTFKPTFTHQLFGDNEQIFGYKNLSMDIQIAADVLKTSFALKYDQVFPKQGDTEADDVEDIWRDVLDQEAFVTQADYVKSLAQLEKESLLPPGKLCRVHKVSETCNYEIWKGTLDNPRVFQAMSSLDFLNPLLIDGGSTITEDPQLPTNQNWTVFFLFRRENDAYTIVGYATIFTLFHYTPTDAAAAAAETKDDFDLSDSAFDLTQLPSTRRLSQFVILPPFQRKGLANMLYSTIYDNLRSDPNTKRIVVESPSNDFDDLRDVCDLIYLDSLPITADIKLSTSYNPPRPSLKGKAAASTTAAKPSFEKAQVLNLAKLKELQTHLKMPQRQFQRLIELHLMSKLPVSVRPAVEEVRAKTTPEDRQQLRLWSLLVKERLVRQHGEALTEMEHEERIMRLNETLHGVGIDHARILEMVQRAKEHQKKLDAMLKNGQTSAKRSLPDDTGSTKRVRAEGP